MPINKISGFSSLLPALLIGLSGGESYLLPPGQGVVSAFGGSGNPAALNPSGFTLTGQYLVGLGPYSVLQMFDSVLQVWRNIQWAGNTPITISSDGQNFRISNLTGCPVGALITNAGTGLTNGFNTVTVTPSAGVSTWNTIVGGAINTTVSITTAGSGYTKPPVLVFNPPANQGSTPYVLPTAVCTISAGAINAVTVTNQGAGLVAAPTITVINQPGDTTGAGGVLTANATLSGSGTLLWMSPTYNGTPLTSVPTFTFSPASTIAATAIMNFTISGITVGTAGAGYGNAQPFAVLTAGAQVAGTAANTNPAWDKGLLISRSANIQGTSTAGGALTATGLVIEDAGYGYEAVPNLFPLAGGSGLATTQGQITATVGAQNDVCVIQSI